jgi:hypothetical protein
MSDDLFLAILAMDAYEPGINTDVKVTGVPISNTTAIKETDCSRK